MLETRDAWVLIEQVDGMPRAATMEAGFRHLMTGVIVKECFGELAEVVKLPGWNVLSSAEAQALREGSPGFGLGSLQDALREEYRYTVWRSLAVDWVSCDEIVARGTSLVAAEKTLGEG